MKYKLLVLDVDGTLLNDEREISKRTLAALLKVQQMGVRIVLASGRPTYGLMPLAKTLELGNYGGFVLSYNGCQIIKAQNGEILFERRINPEMLPYLEKKARKNGFALFKQNLSVLCIDNLTTIIGKDKTSVISKFKRFCQRQQTIGRPAGSQNNTYSHLLNLQQSGQRTFTNFFRIIQ